jgi:hypothetical protein
LATLGGSCSDGLPEDAIACEELHFWETPTLESLPYPICPTTMTVKRNAACSNIVPDDSSIYTLLTWGNLLRPHSPAFSPEPEVQFAVLQLRALWVSGGRSMTGRIPRKVTQMKMKFLSLFQHISPISQSWLQMDGANALLFFPHRRLPPFSYAGEP